ncbi:MAG: hypothetical protein EZS28_041372 [Streblomastix strix]|uniref:Uncharacterized protein n=1 Tax=Streblomastix strix TaxID=222440 RepID=A0A5J4TZK5_9EUKA|nr:MAG: hypothetical protein EZS28_041372 [Streblomastix strix]
MEMSGKQGNTSAETGKKIEKNNGLLTTQYLAEITTFLDERFEQSIGNVDERGLSMSVGHQISVQLRFRDREIGQIPNFYTHREIHYAPVGKSFGISMAARTFAKTIQISIDRVRINSLHQAQLVFPLQTAALFAKCHQFLVV